MLVAILEKHAKRMPDEIGFIAGGVEVTWLSLHRKVKLFCDQLSRRRASRRILYVDGRTSDDLALLIASSSLPGESILVSSFHSESRTKELLSEFDGEDLLAAENDRIKVVGERKKPSPTPSAGTYVCLLTSGTTGSPKCVKYDWERISGAVSENSKYVGRRWLMGYHITNFAGIQVFLQCFVNGGCLVIPDQWPPSWANDVEALSKYQIQYLNCTATYMRKILFSLADDMEIPLKSITLGGEMVDQVLIDSLKRRLPAAKVNHIYASTELGATIEVRDEKEGFPKELLLRGNLRIIEGELYAKKSHRSMLGYLGLTEASSMAPESDSWLPTGDLVDIENDRVIFLGRRDSMVNVGGFKVNPFGVEGVIREVKGVKEVSVSGQKNPIAGNLLKAILVPCSDQDEKELKTRVLEHCRSRLPYYSVPRLFEFREELTYTSSYKVKRNA